MERLAGDGMQAYVAGGSDSKVFFVGNFPGATAYRFKFFGFEDDDQVFVLTQPFAALLTGVAEVVVDDLRVHAEFAGDDSGRDAHGAPGEDLFAPLGDFHALSLGGWHGRTPCCIWTIACGSGLFRLDERVVGQIAAGPAGIGTT